MRLGLRVRLGEVARHESEHVRLCARAAARLHEVLQQHELSLHELALHRTQRRAWLVFVLGVGVGFGLVLGLGLVFGLGLELVLGLGL